MLGDVHTNAAEGFNSRVQRTVAGVIRIEDSLALKIADAERETLATLLEWLVELASTPIRR